MTPYELVSYGLGIGYWYIESIKLNGRINSIELKNPKVLR